MRDFPFRSRAVLYAFIASFAFVSCAKKDAQTEGHSSSTVEVESVAPKKNPPPVFREIPARKPASIFTEAPRETEAAPKRRRNKISREEAPAFTEERAPTALPEKESHIPALALPKEEPRACVVEEEVARALASEDPAATENLYRDFWLWLGTGVNYTIYTQNVLGMSDVKFGKIKALTKSAHAGFFFADEFGLELSYRDVPGEVSRSSLITVTNGAYNWRSFGAEVLYHPENSPWLFRAGLLSQATPFLVPLSANSITVAEASFTALSVGVEYRKKRKNVRIDYSLRYLQPISESSDLTSNFDLKPAFNAQGSMGGAIEVKPNLYLGIRLTVDVQGNSFTYRNGSGTTFSGKQNIFSSSGEVGLGYEF